MSFEKKSVFSAASLGALLSLGVLIGMAALGACIAFSLKNPLGAVKPLSIAVILVSAAISSFLERRLGGSMLSCVISSLMLIFLLLITGIIAGGGKISAGVLINYACYIALGALFSYLGGRKRGKIRRPRRYRR